MLNDEMAAENFVEGGAAEAVAINALVGIVVDTKYEEDTKEVEVVVEAEAKPILQFRTSWTDTTTIKNLRTWEAKDAPMSITYKRIEMKDKVLLQLKHTIRHWLQQSWLQPKQTNHFPHYHQHYQQHQSPQRATDTTLPCNGQLQGPDDPE
jgi:hypothetical protein